VHGIFRGVRNRTAPVRLWLHALLIEQTLLRRSNGTTNPIARRRAMNTIAKIVVAAVAGLVVIGHAQAGEQSMKPLQGWSFHAGTKHAVAYFQTESRNCQLVLTASDDTGYAPARYEAAVEAGKSTTYQMSEGKQIVFTCNGQTMIANPIEASAAN
jgi:hypothetical protein